MKIQLPNGQKQILDPNLPIEAKVDLTLQLTEEWRDSIERNWTSESIIYFLDGLSNYLNWHKEEEEDVKHEGDRLLSPIKNRQDKYVFSIKRIEQMNGKRKSLSIPFSCLPMSKRELLGLEVRMDD